MSTFFGRWRTVIAFMLFGMSCVIAACGSGFTGTAATAPVPFQPGPKLTLYPVPSAFAFPAGIASGSDGNVWFAEVTQNKIARINIANGTITEFQLPSCVTGPEYFAKGSDGNLWVPGVCPQTRQVTMVVVAPDGSMREIPMAQLPFEETLGPDGDIWFTIVGGTGQFGKIAPSGATTYYTIPTPPAHAPAGLTTGPDGNVWMSDGNFIDRVKTDGTIVNEFTGPWGTEGITTGPDRNVWLEADGNDRLERITPGGQLTVFPLHSYCHGGLVLPLNIASGPQGDLWLAEDYADAIAMVTTAGQDTDYCMPETPDGPFDITVGPDGNIWFTIPGLNDVGVLRLR